VLDAPRIILTRHYAGVLAHQQGHSDEAVALIERSLCVAPGRGLLQQPASFSNEALQAGSTRINMRSPSTRVTPSHSNVAWMSDQAAWAKPHIAPPSN
jgi:hypothetical protein